MYFVHSYYLKAEEDIVTARTEYGVSHRCFCGKRKSVRLPVPPGKEFGGWAENFGELCEIRQEATEDVYKTDHSLSGRPLMAG